MLTARLECRGGDLLRSRLDIRVSHDDIRRVGAELGDEFLCAGGAGQRIAGDGAAGKRNGANIAMRCQRKRRFTLTGHHAEQIPGPAGIVEQLREPQGGPRSRERRLGDDGVAGGDRGRDFLHQQIDRRVEV